jgi:hypothetical protein
MSDEKDNLEKQYNIDKEEAIKMLLQSSLVYALKMHDFDGEEYFMEDITSILADYQTIILRSIDDLIIGSFAVMKEFGEKYST